MQWNNSISEDRWFKLYQPVLLGMANTDYGRDLLLIPREYPRITEISKCHVKAHVGQELGKEHFLYDFRVGAKWGNTVRARWEEFQSYARYFVNDNYSQNLSPMTRLSRSVLATTTTAYPDPDPETSTWDGAATAAPTSQTWTDLRANTTMASVLDSGATEFLDVFSTTTTNQYKRMWRLIFGFNTASIADGDTINSATLSLYGGAKDDAAFSQSFVIWKPTSISSSTAATGSDFYLANRDATEQSSTRISIASWNTAGYNDFTLSVLATINKTGVTWLGAMCSGDFDNSAPTWSSNKEAYAGVKMAETALTTSDPKLVVESTAAATGHSLPSLGVGT